MDKTRWTDADIEALKTHNQQPFEQLLALFPGRTRRSIQHKINRLELSHPRPEHHTASTIDKMSAKREAAWATPEYRTNRMAVTYGANLTLSETQKQILMGTVMADAHLHIKQNSINATLVFEHKNGDADYCRWKVEQLRPLFTNNSPWPVHQDGRIYWRAESVSAPLLTDMWRMVYRDKSKIVTPEILAQMKELALAVWFMDDGSLTYSNGYPLVRLYTCKFGEAGSCLIKDWLYSTWGLPFHLYKTVGSGFCPGREYWGLGLSRGQDIQRFFDITRQYISQAMPRKLPR